MSLRVDRQPSCKWQYMVQEGKYSRGTSRKDFCNKNTQDTGSCIFCLWCWCIEMWCLERSGHLENQRSKSRHAEDGRVRIGSGSSGVVELLDSPTPRSPSLRLTIHIVIFFFKSPYCLGYLFSDELPTQNSLTFLQMNLTNTPSLYP